MTRASIGVSKNVKDRFDEFKSFKWKSMTQDEFLIYLIESNLGYLEYIEHLKDDKLKKEYFLEMPPISFQEWKLNKLKKREDDNED